MKLRGQVHNGRRRPKTKAKTPEERAKRQRRWSLEQQRVLSEAKARARALAKAARRARKENR